ncbi:MAG: CRTAC1 family protein [Rubripirellula sp.]
MSKPVLGVLLVLLIAAGIFFASRGNQGGGGPSGGESPAAQQLLDQTRVALAATENLELVEADQVWTSVFEQLTKDPSVALNRAINRVLRVDSLSAIATNPSQDADKQQEARNQLANEAIPGAQSAIEDFAALTSDQVTPIWLSTRVDLQHASLMTLGALMKSQRKAVFKRLADAINGDLGKDPRAMILGGPLIEVIDLLEDPIDGLPPGVLEEAASSLGVLSEHHPDNLFFAIRAALLKIKAKDKQAADFVRSGSVLSAAIEPSIRKDTKPIGLTPDELIQQLVSAIETGDWQTAETKSVLWFNVLNKTEIVKTDRRRAGPHPLDRLSFESLRQLSAEMIQASPLQPGATKVEFAAELISDSKNVTSVCVIDFDLDLDPDLAVLDSEGVLRLWQNDGVGAWSQAGELKLDFPATGLLVADLFEADSSHSQRLKTEATKSGDDSETDYASAARHNTFASLVVFGDEGVRLIQVDGRQSSEAASRLKKIDEVHGLEDVQGVITAVAGDLEADGDLDLVFATESDGVRLFVNRGNRTFFEIPGDQTFGVDPPVTAMAIGDIDRDLDLDLVTVSGGQVGVLENLLHLQFRGRLVKEVPAVEGATMIAVEDVDGNVSWDLIVSGKAGAMIVFSQTAAAGAWTVERTETSNLSFDHAVVSDFDNDSWLEMVSLADGKSGIARLGPWGFGDLQNVSAFQGTTGCSVADFDGDGKTDLAGVQGEQATVFVNQSASVGHHLNVRFKGIADNASGRVNHFAIGSVLECRFGPHYRSRVVTSPVTHFGVAGFESAGSVRVIFPNGLTQTVRDPKVDSLVEEEQTLKGSCPYLYAWDGEKYAFQTDCLWAAPLGLQVARGVVAKDRPWEYLKIDGANIKPRDGKYDFRITEELWEVAYFDKVALTVVDHPADSEVWTNEKVGPGDIATPTIFAFDKDQLLSVKAASDKLGRDVTEKLQLQDRDFVQGFDRRIRQGLCEPHWMDLDFGDTLESVDGSKGARVYLVLTGWILPTDTSLNIQIDQNPEIGPIEFPSVWVPDSNEPTEWRKAIPFMGFPGGKTKTIVVDVTEVMNRQDPRFRVRTSAQIYWDRAAVAVQASPAEFRTEDVQLLSAEVRFHGFSAKQRDQSTLPETYDYQQSSSGARWPPLRGNLTRFGDCESLIRSWDDEMVVISSGDEIRMTFSVPKAEPPAGWKRDFVLHSVGWDKDADLNTLAGQSTGPLPYREMTEYPPTAGDWKKSESLEQINQRHLQRVQSFRSFWYRGDQEPKANFHDRSESIQ